MTLIDALPALLFSREPTPTALQSVAIHRILVDARNYIATHGWIPGWGAADGPTCLFGAIATACGLRRRGDIRFGSGAHIGAQCASVLGFSSIDQGINWNDHHPGLLGKHAVLARLDKAIAATAPAPQLPEISTDVPALDEHTRSHEFELAAV